MSARLALAVSLLAAVLSGAALLAALTRQPPRPYPLVCEQSFTSQACRSYPVWYPCSAVRP